MGKESVYDTEEVGSISGSGRSPGRGNGNPLQYSCLENPMDRGAWQAIVHRVTKCQSQLKQISTQAPTYVEWINTKVLLCGTENHIQYLVINCNAKEYEKNIYVCITESLGYTAAISTTLQTNYTSIKQIKKKISQ